MVLLIEEESILGEEEHLTPPLFLSFPFFFPLLPHFFDMFFSCICAFVPYTLKDSTFYFYDIMVLYSYGIEEECWSMVITSWSRYHTMYAHDWGPHRIACARSPLPLSSLILQ